jgi:hypothetical protein
MNHLILGLSEVTLFRVVLKPDGQPVPNGPICEYRIVSESGIIFIDGKFVKSLASYTCRVFGIAHASSSC